MNYELDLKEIENTPMNSLSDLNELLNLLKTTFPSDPLFKLGNSNIMNENLKSKFNSLIISNKNVTVGDFLKYLYQTDSDFKFIYTQYNKLKTSKVANNNRRKIMNEMDSVGYFLEEKDVYFSGRTEELWYMSLTLNRKIKNNLLLIGEPGVGKTSLVKEYSRISNEKIFVVEMDKVLSNTKYRGEFEQKLAKIIDYSKQNSVTLFIDEIHILLGVGKSEGSLSGADILKPYVTNSNIKVIGATTIDEYEILKTDRALERRFNILKLSEISKEVVFHIYMKLLEYLEIKTLNEENFNSIYNDLQKNKYRKFPDKLIDFMDLYSSHEKMGGTYNLDNVIKMALHYEY
ncbi:AAA family ATPase [Lysinibacillus fusiformis]|uniref:AAA family ATPase n=1 Tax=Lysinibacillus fusiformis TaxID=28031 RepID=UPI003D01BC1A